MDADCLFLQPIDSSGNFKTRSLDLSHVRRHFQKEFRKRDKIFFKKDI